ncbi:c-type cytochrome domain-containing protein [Fodinibius sp.]|uniref:c-type cytochrome domain-containing protein n=1 Tax=Fodinibius sp. TaxID=1872440 RepID=UPI0035654558
MKTHTGTTHYSLFSVKVIRRLLALCTLGILMVSCGDSSTGPDNGGEEPLEPTFSNVLQIFEDNCASCHAGATTSGVRLDSYSNVVNSTGDQYGENVVQPGNANESPLVDKIESNPEFGARMPQGQDPLTSDQIGLIKEWINEGANNN